MIMSEEQRERRPLDDLIEEQLWDQIKERLEENPAEARDIVNPSLGWTKLHWLCSIGSAPEELISFVASLYPEAITLPDNRYGDTPLHIICRNSQTQANKIRSLLEHCVDDADGVLVRNRFGGTALHSASNHNAIIEVLQALIEANPRILRVTTHEGIHAVSALWHAYIQTIPGYMVVAQILEGGTVSEAHFNRFWKKTEFLATEYFRRSPFCVPEPTDLKDYVLHGLIHCNVPINLFRVCLKQLPHTVRVADVTGNFPLHLVLTNRPYRLKERDVVMSLLDVAPDVASKKNLEGDVPLIIAIRNKIPWGNGLDLLLEAWTGAIYHKDSETGLYPFQLAAAVGGKVAVNTVFHLLSTQPDLLTPHLS